MQDETTLVGQIGWITKGILRGYVYAPDDLDRRIVFELYVNDLAVGEFTAEKPRPDLVELNIGDGAYGFALPMTTEHVIAGRNKVEVVVPGTKTVIVRKYVTQTEEQVDALAPGGLTFGSRSPTAEKRPIRGRLDEVGFGRVIGWVYDSADMDAMVEVCIRVNGVDVGTALADRVNPDVREPTAARDLHRYEFDLPAGVLNEGENEIEVYVLPEMSGPLRYPITYTWTAMAELSPRYRPLNDILAPGETIIDGQLFLSDDVIGAGAALIATDYFTAEVLEPLITGAGLPHVRKVRLVEPLADEDEAVEGGSEDAAPAIEAPAFEGEDQDAGPAEEIWFDAEEPVPAGLRDYAATQIFGRKLRLGEAAFSETWPRFLLRLLTHPDSALEINALIAFADEHNNEELGERLRHVASRLPEAVATQSAQDAFIAHPMFTAPASELTISALFKFVLGRETTIKDNVAKSSGEIYDYFLHRVLCSAEFHRRIIERLLNRQPPQFDIEEDLTEDEAGEIERVFGRRPDSQPDRITELLNVITDPDLVAALTVTPRGERFTYIQDILNVLKARLPIDDETPGVAVKVTQPRTWLVKSPAGVDAALDVPLKAVLTLETPIAWQVTSALTPVTDADGMVTWDATLESPILIGSPYAAYGDIRIVRDFGEAAAPEADEPLFNVPVGINFTNDFIKAQLERATQDFDKAVYLANQARFTEARAALRRITETKPFHAQAWLHLAETAYFDEDIADTEAVLDATPLRLFSDTTPFLDLRARLSLAKGDLETARALFEGEDMPPCTDAVNALVRYGAGVRSDDVMVYLAGIPDWVLARIAAVFADMSRPVSGLVHALKADTGIANQPVLTLNLLRALIKAMAPFATLADLVRTAAQIGSLDSRKIIDAAKAEKKMYSVLRLLGEFPPAAFKDDATVLMVTRAIDREGNFPRTLVFAEELVKRKLEDSSALQLAANIMRRKGDINLAIDYMAKALAIKADDKLAERLLSLEMDAIRKNPLHPRVRADKLLKQMVERRQKALFSQPLDPQTRFDYARAALMAEQIDEARAIFGRLAEDNSEWLEPRIELMRLERHVGDDAAFLRCFYALGENALQERWIVAAAKAHRAIGELEEAHAILVQYQDMDSESIRCELVRSHFFIGNFDAAVEEAERWLAVYPESLELRLLTAAACLELGKYEQAYYHTIWVYMNGGPDIYPAEMPLFLYAVSQKVGNIDLALSYLDPMFSRLGARNVGRDQRLGDELFDQLSGAGAYPTGKFPYGPVFKGPLVSVVMTSYNVEQYIGTAVRSILQQSYSNLELIIVDDASTDSTPQLLMDIERSDPRVKVILKTTNDGTYVSKNTGLLQAQGEIIALQDSDDWSHPDRLACSVAVLLKHPELVGLTTDWLRMTTAGDLVIKAGGQISHLCCISLVFRRQPVLEKIGFFDSVRIAADLELIQRIGLVYGQQSVLRLRWPLLFGRARSDSLTASEEFGLSRTGFTEPRQLYHDYSEAFHAQIAAGQSGYLPFPMEKRAFDAPAIILPNKEA